MSESAGCPSRLDVQVGWMSQSAGCPSRLDVQSAGCPVGWMSSRLDVQSAGCLLAGCPSRLDVRVGWMSVGWMSSRLEVQSAGCPVGWMSSRLDVHRLDVFRLDVNRLDVRKSVCDGPQFCDGPQSFWVNLLCDGLFSHPVLHPLGEHCLSFSTQWAAPPTLHSKSCFPTPISCTHGPVQSCGGFVRQATVDIFIINQIQDFAV